jgi:hypothetical protein
LRDRLALPAGECCGKTFAFEEQQFFCAGKELLFGILRRLIAQLNKGLQSHLSIAQV